MSRCPFHHTGEDNGPRHSTVAPGAASLATPDEFAFLVEAHAESPDSAPHGSPERIAQLRALTADGTPAPLTSDELTWAARIAWRNHARCIGRLHWRTLVVRDHRHLSAPDDLYASLREHITFADNGGSIRSVLTVFAPARPGERGPRLLNHQLCGYAGYVAPDGTILGDPRNVALTRTALALGWQPPAPRGRFDLLPWLIVGLDGHARVYPAPRDILREVPLRHPRLPWFEALGLRWYALPVITDMGLRAAGTTFQAIPFNGWYMSTEIAARNLSDTDRYNQLPVIAEKLGLDTRHARTLWQDRALLELNEAALHSYAADGVRLVDHHTASDQFMRFREQEAKAGRAVSADWDWIVPPMSPATTPVFHTPMTAFPQLPDFVRLA